MMRAIPLCTFCSTTLAWIVEGRSKLAPPTCFKVVHIEEGRMPPRWQLAVAFDCVQ